MGLFDDLKKLGKSIGQEIEKSGIKEDFAKIGKGISDSVSSVVGSDDPFGSNKKEKKEKNPEEEIPKDYDEFPRFKGVPFEVKTKKTSKYKRCTMEYFNVPVNEMSDYIYEIETAGYVQGSKVRYDKDNTYIIVDYINGDLEIVFHIKK